MQGFFFWGEVLLMSALLLWAQRSPKDLFTLQRIPQRHLISLEGLKKVKQKSHLVLQNILPQCLFKTNCSYLFSGLFYPQKFFFFQHRTLGFLVKYPCKCKTSSLFFDFMVFLVNNYFVLWTSVLIKETIIVLQKY